MRDWFFIRDKDKGLHQRLAATIVCAALVAAFLFSLLNAAGAAPAPKNIWRVRYARGLYSAPSTVYLASNAVKIVTDGGYEITAKAPDWTASVFRCVQKAYNHRPMKTWKSAGFFVDSDPDLNPKKAVSDVKTTFMGLPARRLTWNTTEVDDYYQERSKSQPSVTQLVETTDIPCLPEQTALLSSWYGIPYLSGVPLQHQRRSSNKVAYPLKAESIEKVSASEVSFELNPPGCKKVAQMRDLIPNKIKDTMMMMFADDSGSKDKGTKSGASKKSYDPDGIDIKGATTRPTNSSSNPTNTRGTSSRK